MSRIKKVLINARVSISFYIISIALGFLSRKIFLDYLGDEFIGLSLTLKSILNFLNLAELGIGTAIGYSLYKPIYEKRFQEINKIFSLLGFLYNRIGFLLIILGLILGLCFPVIFKDTSVSLFLIYYMFFTYLISALLNYFYNYHIQLLQADQKNYISASYHQSFNILKVLMQLWVVYYFKSFYLFITIELLTTIFYNYFLKQKISRTYSWINYDIRNGRNLISELKPIIKKIKQIFVHKISAFILRSTDNILIFSFISLEAVTYLSNYYLITNNILSLITSFFSGSGSAVGNLVAENNGVKISKIFWEMMALRYFIAGIVIIVLLYTTNPFIKVWIGTNYLLSNSVFYLILINLFISMVRTPIDEFINAYGLFSDVWAPITESSINLIISIILIRYIDLEGVLLGTLVSVGTIVMIWKPIYLFRSGFKSKNSEYWLNFTLLVIACVLSFTTVRIIVNVSQIQTPNSLLELFIYGLKILSITVLTHTTIMYLANKGFRDLTKRGTYLITLLK